MTPLRLGSLWLAGLAVFCLGLGAGEDPSQEPAPKTEKKSGKPNVTLDTNLAKFFPSIPHLSARIYATEDVKGQDADLGMSFVSAGLMLPVWRPDKERFEGLYIGGDASLMNITGDAKLPVRDRNFPDELYDLNLSIAYFQRLDNGWTVGGFVRAGSPSDQPFNSLDEISVRAAGFLRMPDGPNNAWMVYVGYDSISDFPCPVPGFGYSFKTDKIRGMIGLPFQTITIEPLENLQIDFSYIPIRNVNAKIAYGPKDLLQGFVSFEWNNKRYLNADRRNEDDRIFYYEKNVKAGIQVMKWKRMTCEVYGGYAFDREFFEGDDYSDRNWNDIEIKDGPFGGVGVRVKF